MTREERWHLYGDRDTAIKAALIASGLNCDRVHIVGGGHCSETWSGGIANRGFDHSLDCYGERGEIVLTWGVEVKP